MPAVRVNMPKPTSLAHSVFLFDDAQRAEVGTLYKQVGREAAIERGLELIGPRMATFVRRPGRCLTRRPTDVLFTCIVGAVACAAGP